MVVRVLKGVLKWLAIAAICYVITFALFSVLLGTNTGEDVCVYTREEKSLNREQYVRNEDGYEIYNPQKHSKDIETYLKSGSKYIVNKANWSFQEKPCVLWPEWARLFRIIYFVIFSILFTVFGGARFILATMFSLFSKDTRNEKSHH